MQAIHYYKIELNTLNDIRKFIEKANTVDEKLTLTNGDNFSVSAQSLMGAIYALEWNELYLVSHKDVYLLFQDFIKNSTVKYIKD